MNYIAFSKLACANVFTGNLIAQMRNKFTRLKIVCYLLENVMLLFKNLLIHNVKRMYTVSMFESCLTDYLHLHSTYASVKCKLMQ